MQTTEEKKMRQFSVQQSGKRALIYADADTNTQLAVFIHGFNGGFLNTWGEFSNLLYTYADSDPVLKNWDYLFIGYRTLGIYGIPSFSHIAGLIRTQIDNALGGVMAQRVGAPYSRVALLGHSLGTLGIRHLVASQTDCPPNTFRSIRKIGLMGSPLNGAGLAHLGQWVAPIGSSLRPNSPEITSLFQAAQSAWNQRPWPPARVVLATEDGVVGNQVKVWSGDEQQIDYLPTSHSAICKPVDFQDDPVVFLRKVLQ